MKEERNMMRKYRIIDVETGEVVAEEAQFYGKEPYLDKGWRKVFVAFLSDVVMNQKISGKAIRLMLWMIENLRKDSLEVYMSPRMVCDVLGITERTYYLWLRTLQEEELVRKIDTNLYELRPYTAVSGQMTNAIRKSVANERKRTKATTKKTATKKKSSTTKKTSTTAKKTTTRRKKEPAA